MIKCQISVVFYETLAYYFKFKIQVLKLLGF